MTYGIKGSYGIMSSGGASVSVPLTIDAVGPTFITVRRGTPASGTLQTWDLEYRLVGAETWTEWATGLTGETETVTGRTPETQYEFRATGYVLLETTSQTSAETGEQSPSAPQKQTSAIMVLGSARASEQTLTDATTWASMAEYPVFPGAGTWTHVRIMAFGAHASPTAPSGLWVGKTAVGSADDPQPIGGMYTAQSLVAPPAGSPAALGFGPICDPIPLDSSGGRRLVVRYALPAGANYAEFINGTDPAKYPYGMSLPLKTALDISSDPAINNPGGGGWGQAFGTMPLLAIEWIGLGTSVVQIVGSGDSQMDGYVAAGQGARGIMGSLRAQMDTDGVTPAIAWGNFACAGQTSAEISANMRSYLLATGAKNVMRQFGSVNDRNGGNAYTQTEADASWALLQDDFAWCEARGIRMVIADVSAGNIEQPWLPAFLSHRDDAIAMVGADRFLDLAATYRDPTTGAFLPGTAGGDGVHASPETQLAAAVAHKAAIVAAFGEAWA